MHMGGQRPRRRTRALLAFSLMAAGLAGGACCYALGPLGMPAAPVNTWHPTAMMGGAMRPLSAGRGMPLRYGAGRPLSGLRGVDARRFYAPTSGYWSHTLPLTPRFAIASRAGHIGMIVAPVTINGKGPFRFLLDTGATRTVLSSATVTRLALPSSADRIRVRGVSGLTTVPLVHVASVASGSLQIHDLSAPVLAGPVLTGVDGILGMDGLSGMRLTADFVRDQVLISNASGDSIPGLYAVHGRFVSQRLLLVEGRIHGVPTEAVIDTGATHSLGNQALLAALTPHGQPALAATARDGVVDATDTDEPGAVHRIPSLQFGDANISNLQVIFGNYPVFKTWGLQDKPALLLGMDVLGTLAAFNIDYRRAELQVLPWPAG